MSYHEKQPQWPIQLSGIDIISADLYNADIVLSSDCVPGTYKKFHDEILGNKKLLIACTKYKDAEVYQEKLEELIQYQKPKSITVASMETDCCRGLCKVVKNAIKKTNEKVTLKEIIVSIDGESIEEYDNCMLD